MIDLKEAVQIAKKGAVDVLGPYAGTEIVGPYEVKITYKRPWGAAAPRFGYRLDEVRWERDCSPKRLERILLARGIDGVLIPPHHGLLDWKDFDWNKFSVIRFGMSAQNPDSNLVTSDVFRAMVMAIKKIHEYGYQRIGFTVNKEFNQRLGVIF